MVHFVCNVIYYKFTSTVILLWFLKPEIVNAAMAGRIVQEEEINMTSELIPASCLDSNVCIVSCRKYFSHSAWAAIQSVVEEMKSHPIWYCGRCKLPIDDDQEDSIICDCCLTWFHFRCVCLKQGPKSKTWFCRYCHTNTN